MTASVTHLLIKARARGARVKSLGASNEIIAWLITAIPDKAFGVILTIFFCIKRTKCLNVVIRPYPRVPINHQLACVLSALARPGRNRRTVVPSTGIVAVFRLKKCLVALDADLNFFRLAFRVLGFTLEWFSRAGFHQRCHMAGGFFPDDLVLAQGDQNRVGDVVRA